MDRETAQQIIHSWPEQLRHEWEASQRWDWCKKHARKYGLQRIYPRLDEAPASALKPYPGTPPFILLRWGGYLGAPEGWMLIEAAKFDRLSTRRKKGCSLTPKSSGEAVANDQTVDRP